MFDDIYYYQVALNVVLPKTFTYASTQPIALGTRVLVSFNRRLLVGVVWQEISVDEIEFDVAKVLPIQEVFADGFVFSEPWRKLIEFASQYYHYPIGQTVATALPAALSQAKSFVPKSEDLIYGISDLGLTASLPKNSSKQLALLQALKQGSLSESQAKKIHPQAKKIMAQWLESGWLTVLATAQGRALSSEHVLNPEQEQACKAIAKEWGHFSVFLLYGITGSGKTEVYFEAISQALALHEQVLFLLPEINLTPQLLSRLQKRFENIDLVVLHSQMPAGERAQNYVKAMQGKAQLIVGTRLSVFTPIANLGLIVVDEEHDSSFKQDNELRYQARDLAIWRAKQASCPIVLGSATPSLETWHKANSGQYQLLRLPERAHQQATLPKIYLDNIARQKTENGFGALACQALQKNYQKGGLSLVYLNRRGFSPVLMCTDCAHSFSCAYCSAKMVLHQRARELRCHHCDYHQVVPSSCPTCGNQDLSAVGHGTQRVEETLRTLLPNAKVVRVDRDSTNHKQDWDLLYQQIQNQEIDVLVGTQMLAKGHDFSQLNLVVVLDADGSLFSADYRAPERLFSELLQVSGRAGRAQTAGHVIVQTRLPEHKVFQSLLEHDYVQFATAELLERQMYQVTPFGHSIAVRVDAPRVQDAMAILKQAKDLVENHDEVSVLGPAPMLMVRLAQRERAQIFLESGNRKALHRMAAYFAHVLPSLLTQCRQARWSIDVDPQEI